MRYGCRRLWSSGLWWDWQLGKEDVLVLTRVPGLPATVVGVEAHERVTAEDYEKV